MRAQLAEPRRVDRLAATRTASGAHETGLVYYGRRYYQPSNGRFLGRDPKQEKGGLNLFGFCSNNAVNRWDYLGMTPLSDALASQTALESAIAELEAEINALQTATDDSQAFASEISQKSSARDSKQVELADVRAEILRLQLQVADGSGSTLELDPSLYGGTYTVTGSVGGGEGSGQGISNDGILGPHTFNSPTVVEQISPINMSFSDPQTGDGWRTYNHHGIQDQTGLAFDAAALAASAASNAAVSVVTQQVRRNAAAGRAFENSVIEALGNGATKNTQRVTSSGLGTAIPDLLTSSALTEIKNATSISFGRQLQIEAAEAASSGIPFNLIVSPRTSYISGPLQEAIHRTGGTITVFDPVTRAFRPWP